MKRAKMALGHKTALSAAMGAVFLVSIVVTKRAAADYYLYYGDPPSGGGIISPTGLWGAGLGPQSGWGWDDQCVVWAYGIQLQAMMYPPFVDRDELWYYDEELQESYFIEYRWDEPSTPTLFWWSAWPALGYITMNTAGTNGTFQPTGLPLGTTSTEVMIQALIDDRPRPDCYDDGPVSAYDPPSVTVTIFDTHLTRDEVNQGFLNLYASANCQMAAQHAYDGNNMPPNPIRCPWGEGLNVPIFDTEGYLATKYPAEIPYQSFQRHNVILYKKKDPGDTSYTAVHVETCAKDGVDRTWGANTASSPPNWNHSTVTGYVEKYSDPEKYPGRKLHVYRYY